MTGVGDKFRFVRLNEKKIARADERIIRAVVCSTNRENLTRNVIGVRQKGRKGFPLII